MSITRDKFIRNEGNKAFAYCRTATGGEAEIKKQEEMISRYAQNYNIFITNTFCDTNQSGSELDRIELQNMLNEVERCKPAYLIVTRLDRLSRSIHDLFIIEERLHELGVEIVVIEETLPKDYETRIMVETLLSAISQRKNHFV